MYSLFQYWNLFMELKEIFKMRFWDVPKIVTYILSMNNLMSLWGATKIQQIFYVSVLFVNIYLFLLVSPIWRLFQYLK